MATNTLSKLLKKKKLTGKEVGKIVLLEMVNEHLGKPTLTPQERDAYVDALVENKDIRAYNDYLSIYRYLGALTIDYESTSRAYAVSALELARIIDSIKSAEQAYFSLVVQPRILTKKDYEASLQKARDCVKRYTWGVFDIIQNEIEEHLRLYENGAETPYKNLFDDAKENLAKGLPAGERYFFVYGEETQDKNISKLNLLANLFDVYTEAETEIEGVELEFKKDFPELTQAILDKYSQLKGLEFLKNISDEDFLKDDLVTFAIAYELNILEARERYDKPILEHCGSTLTSGVAIIDNETWALKEQHANIINGTYYYRLGGMTEYYLAENTLKSTEQINQIKRTLVNLKANAQYLQHFEYILEKIAELTEVRELLVFKKDNGSAVLEHIKNMVDEIFICRAGLMQNEENPAELKASLVNLLKPDFTIDDVKPTQKDIEQVNNLIAQSPSIEKAVMAISNLLLGVSA